jgi:hypothetical protein
MDVGIDHPGQHFLPLPWKYFSGPVYRDNIRQSTHGDDISVFDNCGATTDHTTAFVKGDPPFAL